MTSYTTLVAAKTDLNSIKAWVNHETTPAEAIVAEAQAFIYSKMRTRELRQFVTGAIALDASSFNLPAGYLGSLRLRVVHPLAGAYKLNQTPWHDFEDDIAIGPDGLIPSGPPQIYATDATKAYLNTRVDQALTYRWWLYQQPALLSSTSKTNFLTDKYPHILDSICRSLAFRFWKQNSDADTWLKIGLDGIQTANEMEDQELSDLISENNNA